MINYKDTLISDIINNGMHIMIHPNMLSKIIIISSMPSFNSSYTISSFCCNNFQKYYRGYFSISNSQVYFDKLIKEDYLQIYLGKRIPMNNDNWSPIIHINKIENLLKLKYFL